MLCFLQPPVQVPADAGPSREQDDDEIDDQDFAAKMKAQAMAQRKRMGGEGPARKAVSGPRCWNSVVEVVLFRVGVEDKPGIELRLVEMCSGGWG